MFGLLRLYSHVTTDPAQEERGFAETAFCQ